jgi:hypothetical protein
MTKILTKLTLTNFNPKLFFGQPEGTQELYLGRLIGTGNGVKNAVAQDGVTPMYGLKGTFGAEYSTDREAESSGVLFLPEAYMGPMLDLFEDKTNASGEVEREAVKSLDFAYDVFVIKAANPAGYSWSLRPLLEVAASDPLEAIRARIAAPVQKLALAAPDAKTPPAQVEDKTPKKAK